MRRKEKGITLIALIITIIVLLILAGIAIGALTSNNSVLKQAGSAKNNSIIAEEKDIVSISAMGSMEHEKEGKINEDKLREEINKNKPATVEPKKEDYIVTFNETNNKYMVKSTGEIFNIKWWETEENGTKYITNGKVSLKVGDYIDYDPNDNGELSYTSTSDKTGTENDQTFSTSFNADGWRLLGVYYENGRSHLVVVPNHHIKSTENDGLKLKEAPGYANGVDEIKNISKIYGKGKNASYARSIELKDINDLTGYDPLKTGDGKKFGEGTVKEYMRKVTILCTEHSLIYCDNGTEDYVERPGFTYWDENTKRFKVLATNEQVIVPNDYYGYFVTTLTESSSDEKIGLSSSSTIYKMLFSSVNNIYLANRFSNHRFYGIYSVSSDFLGVRPTGGGYATNYIKNYGNNTITMNYNILPMVFLDSDIDLELNGKKNYADFWKVK